MGTHYKCFEQNKYNYQIVLLNFQLRRIIANNLCIMLHRQDFVTEPRREKTNDLGSDTNRPVQSQKQARSLSFCI